ncbi:DUF31 family protein [Mycoplasmopsis cynos]|nr:DUF31 family protein [Mycoplasmopsis cynos]WQQ16677.1 DUF31 family protein [Mycoplasmopsis cynos]
MMKKLNSILFSGVTSITSLPLIFVASCTQNDSDTNNSNNNDGSIQQPNGIGKKILKTKEEIANYLKNKTQEELFNFNYLYGRNNVNLSDFSVTDFLNKKKSGEILLTLKDQNIDVKIVNLKANNDNDTIDVFLDFNNNLESFTLKGFKKGNPFEQINQRVQPSKSEITKYINSSQNERYNIDFKKYLGPLSNNEKPRDLGTTAKQKEEFDKKARELHLPTYDNANLLGFTIPKYDSNNKVIGLDLKTIGETGKGPADTDSFGISKDDANKNIGLARTITNPTYANIAAQTYQFNISNWKVSYDENERNKTKDLLKNDENISLLIEKIKDNDKKANFQKRFLTAKEHNNRNALKELKSRIIEELEKENGFTKANEIVSEYTKKHIEEIKEKIKKSDLKEETKTRLYPYIDEAFDFYQLEIIYNQKIGGDGTAWIFDYEEPEKGHYPTKFYFATNLHVIDQIDKDEKYFDSFGLTRIDKDKQSLFNTLKVNSFEVLSGRFKAFGFNKEAITRIFDGRDYLTKDPKDFLVDKSFDKKEFIDFAVFEVDFSKSKDYNSEEKAKLVTNDYANWKEEEKASFADFDYLTNYEKIDVPLSIKPGENADEVLNKFDSLYILGYPKSKSNSFFDFFLLENDGQYRNEEQIKAAEYTFSLWTNASFNLYEKNIHQLDEKTLKKAKRGSYLSYNLGYRTFTDKPGISDQFLTTPIIGKNFYRSSKDDKEYVSMSLGYIPKQYAPGGGSSGSSVRNQNNKVVGIIHAGTFTARASVAAALRSNGFNYQGLFGEYNLPQYDVIYGTGKDQKNSYRDEMKKMNKKPTHLFKNGFDKEKVPSNFQFNNSATKNN